MKQKIIKHLSWQRITEYLVLLILNIIIFGFTNPFSSRAVFVIVGFLLLAADITVIVSALLRLFGLLLPGVATRHKRLTAATSSFLISLLALASVGQLSLFDTVVVVVVWALGYFYVSYLRKVPSANR